MGQRPFPTFDRCETSDRICSNFLELLESLAICGIPRSRKILCDFLNHQIQLLVPTRWLGPRAATLCRNAEADPLELCFEPLKGHRQRFAEKNLAADADLNTLVADVGLILGITKKCLMHVDFILSIRKAEEPNERGAVKVSVDLILGNGKTVTWNK